MKNSLLIHCFLVNLRFSPIGFLCILKMYHVRLFIDEKNGGLEWLLDDVGFVSSLSHYYKNLVFLMLLKP